MTIKSNLFASAVLVTPLLFAIGGRNGFSAQIERNDMRDFQSKVSRAASSTDKFRESAANTYFVQCKDQESRFARSEVVRSPTLPIAALAQASAIWQEGNCANTSILKLRRSNKTGFETVFLAEPLEIQRGNGLRIIDWSPDGRRLLFEVVYWQYSSDAGISNTIWLYDSRSGTFGTVPIKEDSSKQTCSTIPNALGFAENGFVVFALEYRSVDEDDQSETGSCEKAATLWQFDPRTNRLSPLQEVPRLKKWAAK